MCSTSPVMRLVFAAAKAILALIGAGKVHNIIASSSPNAMSPAWACVCILPRSFDTKPGREDTDANPEAKRKASCFVQPQIEWQSLGALALSIPPPLRGVLITHTRADERLLEGTVLYRSMGTHQP